MFGVDNAKGEDLELRDDNGKIVAVGPANMGGLADPDPGILQLETDGTLDSNFGDGGNGILIFDDVDDTNVQPRALEIDSNGRPVVGGWFRDNADGREAPFTARVRVNGEGLDTSFGDSGFGSATEPSTGASQWDAIFDLEIDSQDRILFVGNTEDDGGQNDGDNQPTDLLFGRLKADGTADEEFSSDGFATFDGPDDYQYLAGVVLDGDNGFVAVGGRDTASLSGRRTNEAFALGGDITTSSDDGSSSGGGGGLLGPLSLLALGLLPLAGCRRRAA